MFALLFMGGFMRKPMPSGRILKPRYPSNLPTPFNIRSILRLFSRSSIFLLLSDFFLDLAKAISTLTLPFVVYTFKGIIVNPFDFWAK